VHRGPAAAEQYGERFRGQGDPQMEHGGQDLFGEVEPGRTAAPSIAVERQSLFEGVQLLPGHPSQGGIGQQGLVPLRGRRPGRRDVRAWLRVQGVVPFAMECVPGQRHCRHLGVTDTDSGGTGGGVECGTHA
jgi:hypothetical protein